ncbi:hypothetical protein EK0264_08980 [Epidermidibacterium keratini]|uniref:Uncharacterized protein n=1 Tax=Epidermidibacterium keratini TaxID=1891644 RepID=A0A7L4YMM7_9ACTN|nr:hypothetical protein [Epidermidibacterium keratini]QHC00400.1 hypothetical protein EK0264_08980 [Epidermidibacterium keratini]
MNKKVLGGYLQHHWTGAAAGTAMFRRVARTHPDRESAQVLSGMSQEIAQDRRSLQQIMKSVGVKPSRLGSLTGQIAERLGRLKPNGSLLRRSPLTDVIELEALRAAVAAKLSGWQVLRALADHDKRLDAGQLDELQNRALDQQERLAALHRRVATERALR